jgi:hypothetical protein
MSVKLVCVFHPNPNAPIMRTLPLEYQLTRKHLLTCIVKLIGAPVTFEHLGVSRASQHIPGEINHTLVSKELMRSPDPAHRRVGVCTDAWESKCGGFFCTLEVICDPMPGLAWMLRSKIIGSVSLTHTMVQGAAVPLEIALVGVPARPFCTVRLLTSCPLEVSQYKARTLTGEERVTMAEVPATCETALNKLEPELRQLVIARLEHLVSAANKAVSKTETLEAELKASKWASETDSALLTSQLTQLISTMKPECLENFSLTVPSTLEAYKSGDASQILNASLRTIMCANQNMMLMRAGTVPKLAAAVTPVAETPGAKRVRIEEPASAPPPVLTSRQRLEQALFKEFET